MNKRTRGTRSNPKADALSTKVIRYLQANPEEELTRRDVATKFEVDAVDVDDMMQPAIHSRLVLREVSDEHGLVFRLKAATGVFPGALRTRKPARPSIKIDYDAIVIEPGIPIYEPLRHVNRWNPIFARMMVGDSFQLPRAAWDALSHAQFNYRKQHPEVKFSLRKTAEHVRIWRTA